MVKLHFCVCLEFFIQSVTGEDLKFDLQEPPCMWEKSNLDSDKASLLVATVGCFKLHLGEPNIDVDALFIVCIWDDETSNSLMFLEGLAWVLREKLAKKDS